MTTADRPRDELLLREALDVQHDRVKLRSREPLGNGSVAGFEVVDDESMPSLLYFVDTSRLAVRAETGLVLGEQDAPDARVWLHPADPHLPALAPVAFEHAADTLLQRLGIAMTAAPGIVAYRPGRRAVLRIETAVRPVWIKVVRPSRIDRIVRAHEALRAAEIASPVVRGWSSEGLLVLDNAVGTAAMDAHWEPDALLDEVDVLRERLRGVGLTVPAKGVGSRLEWYAARVRGSERASALVDRAAAALAHESTGDRPMQIVHGDLHYGQLFLDAQGSITSVIDVDTAGLGDPAEDPAAFLAHACASALLTSGPNRARVWALADEAAHRWCGDGMVPALTAVHLLGHTVAAGDIGEHDRADALVRVADGLLAGRAPSDAFVAGEI